MSDDRAFLHSSRGVCPGDDNGGHQSECANASGTELVRGRGCRCFGHPVGGSTCAPWLLGHARLAAHECSTNEKVGDIAAINVVLYATLAAEGIVNWLLSKTFNSKEEWEAFEYTRSATKWKRLDLPPGN
jgi:hypothetical protein